MKKLFIIALLGWGSLGCSNGSPPASPRSLERHERNAKGPSDPFQEPPEPVREAQKLPPSDPKDVEALVKGNNEFAFDLYRRLSQKPGNIVFSPYSISNALAMTYAGARGATADEMAKVLHFGLGQEQLHPAFANLIAELQKDDKSRPHQLYVANALWGQQGYPFLDAFLRVGKGHYRARLQELDFGQTEQARRTINQWVEQQTKDRIKELLGPNDLNPVVRLVLTNAIYFKASWATPFLKGETKEALFEVTPTEKIPVAMMRTQVLPFKYFSGNGCQWVELPYNSTPLRLSMIVMLPENGRLANMERALTGSAIEEAVAQLSFHRGTVALPRFKMSAAARLKDELQAMGMALAFSDDADFSAMVGRRELKISNVIHQGYISVDELGSEAAAATAMPIITAPFSPFSFTANRPFVFLIRDNRTESILFLGRVVYPGRVP